MKHIELKEWALLFLSFVNIITLLRIGSISRPLTNRVDHPILLV